MWLDVPDHFLDERHRLGHDHQDEMWEGVLHMVPQPSGRHQRLAYELGAVLLPLAKAKGLVGLQEPAVYRPGGTQSWRIPELGYCRPENYSEERGIEGRAELVVEIRSPYDETYDKLPFYAETGCQEVLVIDRDSCEVELFTLDDEQWRRTTGPVTLTSVGATVTTIGGPGLQVTWDGGSADVTV